MIQTETITHTATTSDSNHAEQVFFNIHHQASLFYLRRTTSTIRKLFELFWMLLAISGFAALICLHLAFVYRGNPTPSLSVNKSSSSSSHHYHPFLSIPSICLPSVPGFRRDMDVTHLVLLEEGQGESFAWDMGYEGHRTGGNATGESRECLSLDVTTSACIAPPFVGNISAITSGLTRVHFSFSKTKGFAFLTPDLTNPSSSTAKYGISTQIVAISKTDVRCFGEPFLQQAVFRILGPDLVMINWLLAVSNGSGYIYNPSKDQIIDLERHPITNIRNANNRFPLFSIEHVFDAAQWRAWFRPWGSKIRNAMKTCLIYFISTNLVSFLMRVAQERILELSIQIQNHQQENRSIIPLFVTHVADCFVFIPIAVGVLFYLKEFYQGDWVIALTFLAVVFICELFSFFSCRTAQGIFFFPRTFFLLFCLVHFYLFSFPFGFSYVAMGMIVCFMLQCVTFFWNRFEVPAVALGRVAFQGRHRIDNNGENENIVTRGSMAQRRELTSPDRVQQNFPSSPPRSETQSPVESPEQLFRLTLQPQYQPQPSIHYTYSQGTFSQISQGLMSRASSEAIFIPNNDIDDDGSESCVYFLGGEVVLRRENNRAHQSRSSSSSRDGEIANHDLRRSNHISLNSQMNRYDSMSTLQSTAAHGFSDEVTPSGLQVIHDLTPRLRNVSQHPETTENAGSGAPVFPTLESSSI